jgi:predicted nucleic acid-binding protein
VRSIVADTGPLVALFYRRDRNHARVREFLRENSCVLLTTWPVATEVWHLLPRHARLDFMRWIVGGGLTAFDIVPDGAQAMLELLDKYRDRPMDLADASLVALADRLDIVEVLTVDEADFDTYRLPGGRRFVQVLQASRSR